MDGSAGRAIVRAGKTTVVRASSWSAPGGRRPVSAHDGPITMTRARSWIGSASSRLCGARCARAANASRSSPRAHSIRSGGEAAPPPVRLAGVHRIRHRQRSLRRSRSWLQTVGERRRSGTGSRRRCQHRRMAHISAARSIRIGRNVLFARIVFVTDHSHRFDDLRTAVMSPGITEPRPIMIGDGAWIGANVVVLPGVRSGRSDRRGELRGSRRVPPHSVAVGAPARVVQTVGGRRPRLPPRLDDTRRPPRAVDRPESCAAPRANVDGPCFRVQRDAPRCDLPSRARTRDRTPMRSGSLIVSSGH